MMSDREVDRTSAGFELVAHVLGDAYHDLPPEVSERTKMLVLDQLGCSLVGMELPSGERALRYAEMCGGTAESSVLSVSRRLPAALAAWVNGTAGHAAELDCPHATVDFRATGHPATVIVPAALAVAERQRSTGRELLEAVAAGFDAGVRTVSVTGGLSWMRETHGLYAGCLHSVGAALASARLLELDVDQSLHAAALSIGQALSPVAFFGERQHISKSITKGGQPAFAGVAGALQAAAGLEGIDDIFTADGGVIDTWGEPGREQLLTEGLGEDHAVMGANFKFYAAGYPIHSAVEAALSLADTHRLTTDQIKSVTVGMPRFPSTVVDSRNMPTICMQDMLSVALVAGALGFDEAHSDELLRHPEVLRLRGVVKVVVDDELEARQPHGRGSRVTLVTNGGPRTLLVEHPRGHRFREGAVTWEDLRGKWSPLVSSRFSRLRYDQLEETCRSLESLSNISDLADLTLP